MKISLLIVPIVFKLLFNYNIAYRIMESKYIILCNLCSGELRITNDNYNITPYNFNKYNKDICKDHDAHIASRNNNACVLQVLRESVMTNNASDAELLKFNAFLGDKDEYCTIQEDISCNYSSCNLISLCCYTNFCNSAEHFNLTGLVLYSAERDQKLQNSYSRYTKTKCNLTQNKGYENCVVANYNVSNDNNRDRLQYDIINSTASTSTSFAEKLKSSQYLLSLINGYIINHLYFN